MSAYNASAPVMHRTTAPKARKPRMEFPSRKCMACSGLMAASTEGLPIMAAAPNTARTANQSSITGPNRAPTPALPLR
ncbi:hypothetical protein D3C73_1040500 [compost metagenome]